MSSTITTQQSKWTDLQTQLTQIEQKAGSTGQVSQEEVDALKANMQDYLKDFDTKSGAGVTQDQINATLGKLDTIIGENKTDGSNNAAWEQATTAVDSMLQQMNDTDSGDANQVAEKNDFNATVQINTSGQPDATTATQLTNFLNAHSDLPANFSAAAKDIITKLTNKSAAVSNSDIAALGVMLGSNPAGTAGVSDGSKGPGTSYFKSSTTLPGDLQSLQQVQNVNYIADASPPVYVTSDNSKPAKYAVYDTDGKIMGSGLYAPSALGLGNGKWLNLASDGIQNAKSTTDLKSLNLPTNTYLYTVNGGANGQLNHDTANEALYGFSSK